LTPTGAASDLKHYAPPCRSRGILKTGAASRSVRFRAPSSTGSDGGDGVEGGANDPPGRSPSRGGSKVYLASVGSRKGGAAVPAGGEAGSSPGEGHRGLVRDAPSVGRRGGASSAAVRALVRDASDRGRDSTALAGIGVNHSELPTHCITCRCPRHLLCALCPRPPAVIYSPRPGSDLQLCTCRAPCAHAHHHHLHPRRGGGVRVGHAHGRVDVRTPGGVSALTHSSYSPSKRAPLQRAVADAVWRCKTVRDSVPLSPTHFTSPPP
jgi:hypothetical protein